MWMIKRLFVLAILLIAAYRIDELEQHRTHSAITNPRYAKSTSGDSIRIDYGAKDCYYTITLVKEMG